MKFLSVKNFLQNGIHLKNARTQDRQDTKYGKQAIAMYVSAIAFLAAGISYAAVPLYRLFCQSTGYGGTVKKVHNLEEIQHMTPSKRLITIHFNADVSQNMSWVFEPQQKEIKVHPGETVLAFFTASNPLDKSIVGVSTYNVVPFEAGAYFNKIQCFCFEEQILNAHEQIDLPVFFYLDPKFTKDPQMDKVNDVTLSYTFFKSKEQF